MLARDLILEDDGGLHPMKDIDVLRWLLQSYVQSHETTKRYVYGDTSDKDWEARSKQCG